MFLHRVRQLPILPALCLAIGCQQTSDGEMIDDGVCIDDASFFRDQVYPQVVQDTCMACHTADGLAATSGLVFVTSARPDHEAVNRAALDDAAGLERNGTSIVLLKPLGEESHGGGAVLSEGDAGYELLQEYVARLATPTVCEDAGDAQTGDHGLVLLSPVETLRKASLLLVGRLPTRTETERVRAGGEDALVTLLWELMSEDAFAEVFMERLNDVFHTDRYLRSNDGLGIVDDELFPGVYWYESGYGSDYDTFRNRTARAIAREPLELAAHLVRNDLPWTEVLTADYTMVNAYSAMAYQVDGAVVPDPDDPASFDFRPAKLAGFPHAGMLSTPAFLNRFPTTPTNRNRHRAWVFYKNFLATDILTFADRPIDPTVSEAHNPTLNDPQCTVCHATMDPVAGAFQNWDEEGRFRPPEEGWYAEMRSPGFGEAVMPATSRTRSLAWLAEQAVADARFPVSAVRTMLQAFTGLELYTSLTAGDDPARKTALAEQDAFVSEVADELVARGWDIKYAIERVVTSRYFRAVASTDATEGTLLHAGTARLLTPEELDRKIIATTGYPWRPSRTSASYLLDRYRMLYGGTDSFSVLERLKDPNGVIAAIGLRMANEVACEAVPNDFVLDARQRRLFPHVELTYMPQTADGFDVPGAEEAIRRNLQWMHLRLLGEDLALDDPEIDASYQLWLDAWKAGQEGLRAGELSTSLASACSAQSDPFTGVSLPEARRVTRDPDFTLRAWVAVSTYLLSDWRFLHE